MLFFSWWEQQDKEILHSGCFPMRQDIVVFLPSDVSIAAREARRNLLTPVETCLAARLWSDGAIHSACAASSRNLVHELQRHVPQEATIEVIGTVNPSPGVLKELWRCLPTMQHCENWARWRPGYNNSDSLTLGLDERSDFASGWRGTTIFFKDGVVDISHYMFFSISVGGVGIWYSCCQKNSNSQSICIRRKYICCIL